MWAKKNFLVHFSVLSLLFCSLLIFPYVGFAEFQKTKIAVLDFELRGDSFKTKGMGGIVAEWFTTTLVQDGRFEVVERALLQKIVTEQKLGMTGLIDKNSSSQLGKLLGVKTIITGSVLQIQDTIEVNARIINVQTGSIIAAENIRSTTGTNLRKVIQLLTKRIMKNFPLTGYIVKKHDQTVLIDLGASSGLQLDMDFIVYKEGEIIKHPKTGEILEVEQIPTGVIRIVKIGSIISNAKIISEKQDEKIEYGQLVQSVRKADALQRDQDTQSKKITPSITEKESTTSSKKEPVSEDSAALPKGERDELESGGQGPLLMPLKTGFFMMGSNRFSEKPIHYVKIDHLVMLMTTEVTFSDYDRYCLDTGHPFPDDSGWGRDNRPVINVSWKDAQDYAKWLTEQTGITYRLPLETEWEWAAGAGGDTIYTWGDAFKVDMANCKTCTKTTRKKQTTPIASYPPNPFGFYDMAGNVWEWVEDCWVENYKNAPADQSVRQYTGKCGNYTIRGGGWNSPKRQITVSSRLGVWANTKSNYIGFRLVRDQENEITYQKTTPDTQKSTNKNSDKKNHKKWWKKKDKKTTTSTSTFTNEDK